MRSARTYRSRAFSGCPRSLHARPRLVRVPATRTWSGPYARSRIRSARSHRSRAFSGFPRLRHASPRPSRVTATRTWSGPYARSKIGSARSNRSRAFSGFPRSRQATPRLCRVTATSTWSGPYARSKIRSARSNRSRAFSGFPRSRQAAPRLSRVRATSTWSGPYAASASSSRRCPGGISARGSRRVWLKSAARPSQPAPGSSKRTMRAHAAVAVPASPATWAWKPIRPMASESSAVTASSSTAAHTAGDGGSSAARISATSGCARTASREFWTAGRRSRAPWSVGAQAHSQCDRLAELGRDRSLLGGPGLVAGGGDRGDDPQPGRALPAAAQQLGRDDTGSEGVHSVQPEDEPHRRLQPGQDVEVVQDLAQSLRRHRGEHHAPGAAATGHLVGGPGDAAGGGADEQQQTLRAQPLARQRISVAVDVERQPLAGLGVPVRERRRHHSQHVGVDLIRSRTGTP